MSCYILAGDYTLILAADGSPLEGATGCSDSVSSSSSSSCSLTVDALGQRAIAVNQPPGGGDDYPFLVADETSLLIADLYLAYRDDICGLQKPFRVRWLSGFGCLPAEDDAVEREHARDVLIEDANEEVVFDSRNADSFSSQPWGQRLRILTWQNEAEDAVLRVVQHTAWPPDVDPQFFPSYYEPADGRLDERTLERLLPRVRTLRLDLGSPLRSRLKFANGFNSRLELTQAGDRRPESVLTFHFSPGDGRGKFGPACDDVDGPALRRLNGATPDSQGNVLLRTDDCLRVERPVRSATGDSPNREIVLRDHALQIASDCAPCCDCEDFTDSYEALRRVRNRIADLHGRLLAVRDLLASNIARMNESAACRAEDRLRLVIRPVCPDEVAISVGYCHQGPECLRNLIIPISFEYADLTGGEPELSADTSFSGAEPSVMCRSTFRGGNSEPNPQQGTSEGSLEYYELGGKYPHFYAAWDVVKPGQMAQVTFRMSSAGSQIGDFIDVVADAYSVLGAAESLTGDVEIPIPGYTPGGGPTGGEAQDARLVSRAKKVTSKLLQEDCCPPDSLSET